MTMQEKLLVAFKDAYYEEMDCRAAGDRHQIFAEELFDNFGYIVTREQAKNIADSIAANGVTICKSGDKVLEVLG